MNTRRMGRELEALSVSHFSSFANFSLHWTFLPETMITVNFAKW